MPDISMCGNIRCATRMKCYRYRAVPNEYQTYFVHNRMKFQPNCEYFFEIGSRKVRSEETMIGMEKAWLAAKNGGRP